MSNCSCTLYPPRGILPPFALPYMPKEVIVQYAKELCWIGEMSSSRGHDCLVWVVLCEPKGTRTICGAPVLCRKAQAITILEDYLDEAATRIDSYCQGQMGLPRQGLGEALPYGCGVYVRWFLGGRKTPRGIFANHTLRCEFGVGKPKRPCDAEIVLYDSGLPGSGPGPLGRSPTLWAEHLAAMEGVEEIDNCP